MKITDSLVYVGVEDKTLDLFEGQYPIPNGVTYNSYVILDDKIAIMDTVDKRGQDIWLKNIEAVLKDKIPDYLVVSHMEPDHGASIQILSEKYPSMKIVGNVKTFTMMEQFFHTDFIQQKMIVKEGDTLCLGKHNLQFIMAPMVHWPEVMMSYEQHEKTLFSADAFGTFGSFDQELWEEEARRYYLNIVGKYGLQVQNVLKKAKMLDIQMICPLHGPVLNNHLDEYIHHYCLWSQYQPEESGVLIAYASIHGNTKDAVMYLAHLLEMQGETVVMHDLCRTDVSYVVADAFRYDRLILASSSYDGGVFCPMETLLHHLKSKNFQNRDIALIENGTWAPSAIKAMNEFLEPMKNIHIMEPTVTIRSTLSEKNKAEFQILIKSIMEGGCKDEICV